MSESNEQPAAVDVDAMSDDELDSFLEEHTGIDAEAMENSDVIDEPEEVETHPLDTAFTELKSDFDTVMASEVSADEKLQAIQVPFNAFGTTLAEMFKADPDEVIEVKETDELVKALSEVMQPFAQKLDLLTTQLAQQPQVETPVRRSIAPTTVLQPLDMQPQKPLSIHNQVRQSVGLPLQ